MDELINILDSEGNFMKETKLKSYAHRMGLFHATTHIWCYTTEGTILLQQRASTKTTFPLLWDVSVAGHIGSGEDIEVAALREMEEEIGYTVTAQDLEKIGVFKSMQRHTNGIIDNEFHHTFLCKLKVPLAGLRKQDSEVASLQFISIQEFQEAVKHPECAKNYVPHHPSYYHTVLKAIEERL